MAELFAQLRPGETPPERLLALDPGGTTGLAFFEGLALSSVQQLNTSSTDHGFYEIELALQRFKPTLLVMEDYRVYASKARQHINSDIHTVRLIGGIEFLCQLYNLPKPPKQGAGLAKGWVTDQRLHDLGMYTPGLNHGRDATRHGVYYILFHAHGGLDEQPRRTALAETYPTRIEQVQCEGATRTDR